MVYTNDDVLGVKMAHLVAPHLFGNVLIGIQ